MNGRWTDGSKGLRLWWDNMLVYRDGGGAPGSNWLDGYKFLYEPDNVEFNLSDNNNKCESDKMIDFLVFLVVSLSKI